jgi:hypothetical protein
MQLASLARTPVKRKIVSGPRDIEMRRARTCYDHIAGRLGIAIAERLIEQGAITFDGETGMVTDQAKNALKSIGMDLDTSNASSRRISCRPCLDWSERRHHLAGRLGALICSHCLTNGWLRQRAGARSLEITAKGAIGLKDWLGAGRWQQVG